MFISITYNLYKIAVFINDINRLIILNIFFMSIYFIKFLETFFQSKSENDFGI